ncbi:hypothetical protein OHS17_04570 [Streptomyces sp. NBC_00523]|uniref:hypothetical protein n=1 Tax=unclassified Streptomyces TaxID=2593676 RepID=UPI002E803AED|nr:hypothetical protein [Streptomyces sp. NBC_00523]WUD04162.1 hypothetical protein OHS17_04570 [Streptomyces sp. NBC_00523]
MKLLVCLAVATLTGCVSVQPHPAAPPRPGAGRPAHDLAPQTAGPPVHDTLEAVPKAKPSRTASPSAAHKPSPERPAAPLGEPRLALPQRPAPAPDMPLPRRIAPPPPAPVLPAPGSGAGVCDLGRGYGHWPAGSPQSRICDRTYGR